MNNTILIRVMLLSAVGTIVSLGSYIWAIYVMMESFSNVTIPSWVTIPAILGLNAVSTYASITGLGKMYEELGLPAVVIPTYEAILSNAVWIGVTWLVVGLFYNPTIMYMVITSEIITVYVIAMCVYLQFVVKRQNRIQMMSNNI